MKAATVYVGLILSEKTKCLLSVFNLVVAGDIRGRMVIKLDNAWLETSVNGL